MACIFSVAEKEFLHTVHKTDRYIYRYSITVSKLARIFTEGWVCVTHEFCEICVLNPQDLHTIRISISCGLFFFKCGSNTWLYKKVLIIGLAYFINLSWHPRKRI